MVVLILAGCIGQGPSGSSSSRQEGAEPVASAKKPSRLEPGLVRAGAPKEQTVDRGWLRLPNTSRVSQPGWPDPLIDPSMCDAIAEGAPVGADGCVTAEIACGDSLIDHTVGGVDRYDTRFYEKKFCWPATVKHDRGNERVYRLKMPPGEWRAWVTLYSPCGDLNLAAMRYDDPNCPTMDSRIRVCEMSVKTGTIADRVELTTQTGPSGEPTWYVVVEGRDDNDGPFSLHVQCAPGLGGPIDPGSLIGEPGSKR